MFGIGFPELILILIIGLVVLWILPCCFRFRIRGFHAFSPDFPDRSPINRKSIMQS